MSALGEDVTAVRLSRAAFRKEKVRKAVENAEKSLCVKLAKKRADKETLERVLKNVHPGVDRVHLPRQKYPKFAFVRCKDAEIRKDVYEAIRSLKDESLGLRKVTNSRKLKPEDFQIKKVDRRKSIDPLTLVLEMIPKELRTQDIQAEFPKCKKVSRFNPRRAYVYFKSAEDGLEAFQQLESGELCGVKVKPKFRKVNCKKAIQHKKQMASKADLTSEADLTCSEDAEDDTDSNAEDDDKDNTNSDNDNNSEDE